MGVSATERIVTMNENEKDTDVEAITITQKRYEYLVRAETTLDILCRAIKNDEP